MKIYKFKQYKYNKINTNPHKGKLIWGGPGLLYILYVSCIKICVYFVYNTCITLNKILYCTKMHL